MADETSKRLRTAIYCRVSTAMDRQDGSFETQSEHYRRLVENSETMELVDIYGDHGKSGRHIKGRPELQRLLVDCKAGKVDLILTKSISRFARNVKECVQMVRELNDLGVRIYFEKEKIDSKNMVGELLMTLLATVAEAESNSLSENVKWSRKRNYQMGRPIEKASYGYRSYGKEHKWIVHEEEAKRVQLAFYLAGIGYNNAEIREGLNTFERSQGSDRIWNQTPIMNLLSNYAYVGDYLSNKETVIYVDGEPRRRKNRGEADQYFISNHHEAIVSHELFDCIQEMMKHHLFFVKKVNYSAYEKQLIRRARKIAEEEFCDQIYTD